MIEATPNIGPESYFEQRPPDRLIGFETEYDARTSSGQEDSHAVAQMLHKSNFEQIGLRTTGTSTRKWVENGSFVHIDVGHVESAAAESAGAREATIAQHSTATTLGKLAADTPHLRIFRRSATVDPKTGKVITKGFHCSFCIPGNALNARDMPILESHLVTQAYAWGGMLTRQGYNISPKALGVGAEIVTNGQGERTLEGKKPMGILLDKNNPQVDNTNSGNYGFGRFEDRTKTPSSPWSDFMGAATTSLLLRVLERPELQVARNKLRLLALEDPVRDFKRVSWGTNLACTHLTKSGAILTTAELQDEYAMITGEALQNIDLSQAEQYAFGEWLSINGELKKAKDKPDEILGLADRIGWAQKYYYLVRKFGYAALGSPSEKMYAECLHWDRVFPVGRAQKLALDRDPLGITAEDLEWYVNNPPQTTRARRRGAYIKAYGDELSDTAWSHFDLYGQTHRLHPYDNRLPNQ